MKKILLLLTILVLTLLMNGVEISADNHVNYDPAPSGFSKKMYIDNLIYRIEDESEIKIPDYVNFNYIEYMYNLGVEFNVPIRMIFRLVMRESSFIEDAISPEGAMGFFQIMPKTRALYVKKLGLDTLLFNNNAKNIYIGIYMLKESHDFWVARGNSDKYSWKLSLACFNAGIVAVYKHKGVPPFKETQEYIAYVLKSQPQAAIQVTQVKTYNTKKVSVEKTYYSAKRISQVKKANSYVSYVLKPQVQPQPKSQVIKTYLAKK
jgi:soluble lytic murein transglycosylase-like protein